MAAIYKTRDLNSECDSPSLSEVEMTNFASPNNSKNKLIERCDEVDRKFTFRKRITPFPWKIFFVISSLPFALAPIVILAKAAEAASVGYLQSRECYPNGLWSRKPDATWRIMDRSYFFTPNLSFGQMTFTQVKVIDIAWDLLIGRGGQILLAWVNYKVFNEWLLYHMELHLTSYKMYTAVAFQTTSLSTLGVLGKEFLAFGQANWTRFFRWLAMLSMIISTLYVLSFPTLMAAMTGYITTYSAYVEDNKGDLVAFKRFQEVEYLIHDSKRIGYDFEPLVVVKNDTTLKKVVDNYIDAYTNSGAPPSNNGTDIHTSQDRSLINSSEAMTADYNWTWQRLTSSVWIFEDSAIELSGTTLNITLVPNNNVREFDNSFFTTGGRDGTVYTASHMLSHGSCQPTESYQWGFSYIFLFMVAIFNFIWSCIMVGMWIDTTRASRMYKSGRRPGLLRSVLDLAAVIKEEVGRDVDTMEEEELRKALRHSGGALMVPLNELRIGRTRTGEEGVRKRGWKMVTKGSTF